MTYTRSVDEAHFASGYAIAETVDEAQALVDENPYLQIHEMREGMCWPGAPEERAFVRSACGAEIISISKVVTENRSVKPGYELLSALARMFR